jgi:hypothetical protein
MRFRLTLVVWGDWHVGQLVAHGLPSLRASGNLDAVDYVISAHTRPADLGRVAAALEGLNAELRAPIADDTGGDQTAANSTIYGYSAQDIRAAAAAGEAWGQLAPDMVWSEGTFARYRQLIEAGNRVVFRPLLRVDAEKTGTIREFGRRHLARLALECEHEMGKIYRADAQRFTTHAEAIVWLAPDGRLHQTISADVALCVANRTPMTPQFLSDEEFCPGMAVVADSDDSVALAMCPADKHYEWQLGAGPLSPSLVREFLATYPSPACRGLAGRPYRLHAVDTDPASWAEAERRAADFIAQVFDGGALPARHQARQAGPAMPVPPRPQAAAIDRMKDGIWTGTLMR